MAETNLSKSKQGYGYKYTELSQINEYIESIGGRYYQYIEPLEGNDYIYTVKVDKDGKESQPLRGCRVIYSGTLSGKSNIAQEMGSGITYARRYSLLLAYGLATEDDDAACMTKTAPKQRDVSSLAKQTANAIPTPISESTVGQIQYLAKAKGIIIPQICERYGVKNLTNLTVAQGEDCLKALNNTKGVKHE